MVALRSETKSADELIVAKALTHAAHYWGLSNKQLGAIIGLSEPSVSRLKNPNPPLKKNDKSWQLAVMFLRIFRGLDAYMGGHIDNEKLWLRSKNSALGGVPLELMSNVEGLAHLLQYMDYMRGK